ncbi:MAG: menaquinone biosynthetic enzyme MqnA/MqnD family protein [Thermoguttaceae bacterium]
MTNSQRKSLRIGAVQYLNSKPLVECLPDLFPGAQVVTDLPSRLADGLADGRFDVALIPSVEALRIPGVRVVSDACVSCNGPVRSVKLFGRVTPDRIKTLALDEGSRTSAALARILLGERFGVWPQFRPLPITAVVADFDADAAVVIGDRAMSPIDDSFAFQWDLGAEWLRWTALPFVFAMWTAGPHVDCDGLSERFAEARNCGLRLCPQIARREAPNLPISEQECLSYFYDALVFRLGPQQREGLLRFRNLAVAHGLAPPEARFVFHD